MPDRDRPGPSALPLPARRGAALVVALLLSACGGAVPPLRVANATGPGAPSWLASPDLEARTRAVAAVAAGRWGGADLDGWTVRFVSAIDACGGATAADGAVQGCTRPGSRVIDVRVDGGSPCVEATALLHEVGHVALPGDPGHADPRWADPAFWVSLLSDLEREVTASDARCAQDLAVWKLWWAGS